MLDYLQSYLQFVVGLLLSYLQWVTSFLLNYVHYNWNCGEQRGASFYFDLYCSLSKIQAIDSVERGKLVFLDLKEWEVPESQTPSPHLIGKNNLKCNHWHIPLSH